MVQKENKVNQANQVLRVLLTDDYVVSVEEGESAYELVITYANGTKKTISMPKATSVVSGVKFIPTFLSEGEAARIHFPTIVTDSVAGKTEITGADWGYK